MKENNIVIRGAREHNLKNISLSIPRDKLTVITGLSGSGKSSLAFDTLYAEGQRRYVESLSSYARQFLGQMEKPDVDSITGLSPAISIDQKTTSRNPRSTVGTVTEIHDYLRILYARAGIPHCTKCGKPIERQSVDQMVEQIMRLGEGTKVILLAPVIRAKKGEHIKILDGLAKAGFARARIDGEMRELEEEIKLAKTKRHTIEAVIDRIKLKSDSHGRLADSIETALKLSEGLLLVHNMDDGTEWMMSESYACPDCRISIGELAPRMFSFNSPFGACPACTGLGVLLKIDENLVVRDPKLSLREGAVRASGWNLSAWEKWNFGRIAAAAQHFGFSLDVPFCELSDEAKKIVLYGSGDEIVHSIWKSAAGEHSIDKPFEGVIPNLERRFRESNSESVKSEIRQYMYEVPCDECGGARYNKAALAVKIGGLNIAELSDMPINEIKSFLDSVELTPRQQAVASRVMKELGARLQFLMDVGLEYLTLSRSAVTLSGGEAQRIRLATQIGSGLAGVLYILDEPSIGLHQRDNTKLISTLKGLRDIGNTLIVVEHDEDTMREADMVIDIGPGAGEHGGEVTAMGTAEELAANPVSITGKYLSGELSIPVPEQRRKPERGFISIRGASVNNLKNIDVDIPIGVITAITGVSGSGKSSLVSEVLYKYAAKAVYGSKVRAEGCKEILGLDKLDKIINIDQSPIGRTPRSNPATYTGVFDHIRELFAMTPDAKARGYSKGRFSFNVKGGRCEACKGDGIIRIEMHFLPDVYVPCEVCGGKRYTAETLEVRYKGKNIYEVLDMTVEEALDFFSSITRISGVLQTLYDVGLGYIRLGQPSTQLSGGEAQRIKLATYLSRRQTGRTLFILDEPTTGLHTHDVSRLVVMLDRLAQSGNSVVVIEHNLDVIKCADYVIDMGPEGGAAGGTVIAAGTPEQIAEIPESYTGQFLKPKLQI